MGTPPRNAPLYIRSAEPTAMDMVFIFFVFNLHFATLLAGEVALDVYPDNLYELSYVGQDVQCVCRHNLTGYDDTLPRWKINDKMYLSTGLPSPFEPRNREQYFGISFTSIKKINHTTIRCCYFPNTEDTCSSVFTIRIADNLRIIDHPRNKTAEEGEMVKMDCGYVGTGALPLWKINGITYTSTGLPLQFTALRDGIQFKAIPALNGVEFQCFFQGGMSIKSDMGRVHVRQTTMEQNLTQSLTEPSEIAGVYQDPILDDFYNVYWISHSTNTTNHTVVLYNRNCVRVEPSLVASSVGNDPISFNSSKLSITKYLFQLHESGKDSSDTTLYDLIPGSEGVWYHSENGKFNMSFNRDMNQEVCIVDLMQNVAERCSFQVEYFPDPFEDCSDSPYSTYGQVCADVNQLKNMTLFTTFEGIHNFCPTQSDLTYSKTNASHILFIIGPPLQPPKPCAYVDSQSNAILCFQHPYTHLKSPISSYNISIGNSNQLYKHPLLPSEVCQPFSIPSNLTLPLNFSISAMNGAGYSNESEYITVKEERNEDVFCSCLTSEFDIPVHLRVNGETVEISLDEQPPNFPDALQMDICDATLHLMKNAEDVQPHTVLDPCNSSSVSLHLEKLSPDTNYTVFAEVPLRINGTNLTCNLTTNSTQLITDSRVNVVGIVLGAIAAVIIVILMIVATIVLVIYCVVRKKAREAYKPEENGPQQAGTGNNQQLGQDATGINQDQAPGTRHEEPSVTAIQTERSLQIEVQDQATDYAIPAKQKDQPKKETFV